MSQQISDEPNSTCQAEVSLDLEKADDTARPEDSPGKETSTDESLEAAPSNWFVNYFKKWAGEPGKRSPPMVHWTEVLYAFIGTMMGIATVALLNWNLDPVSENDLVMIIGSFGATAVLIYAAPSVPLAQPRNVIGGHLISAFVGVTVRKLLLDTICDGKCLWLSGSLAVALAINAMQVTKTLHPPGGATSLIAVLPSPAIYKLDYMYCICPAFTGACLMVLVALIVNNATPTRRYPVYWW
eukprot:TRINITY_DN84726_c0_g1_i1.p1 TRINITY_DN84726_c0_g1~~TRINITY_DN84726_c0_g1_i1.p1  ORF type:complete len:241 (+),score=33.46 TRINITY_DN84726_c0_g1_i1:150-872(+)